MLQSNVQINKNVLLHQKTPVHARVIMFLFSNKLYLPYIERGKKKVKKGLFNDGRREKRRDKESQSTVIFNKMHANKR